MFAPDLLPTERRKGRRLEACASGLSEKFLMLKESNVGSVSEGAWAFVVWCVGGVESCQPRERTTASEEKKRKREVKLERWRRMEVKKSEAKVEISENDQEAWE